MLMDFNQFLSVCCNCNLYDYSRATDDQKAAYIVLYRKYLSDVEKLDEFLKIIKEDESVISDYLTKEIDRKVLLMLEIKYIKKGSRAMLNSNEFYKKAYGITDFNKLSVDEKSEEIKITKPSKSMMHWE